MITLLPAIDIIEGRCVRLEKGDYSRVIVFNESPIDAARRWEEEGAAFLHVVDLDGAKNGKPVNDSIISRLIQAVKIPVEVGGGVRDLMAFRHYLDMGAKRIILGSVAFRNPQVLEKALALSPSSVAVSLDSLNGKIALEGWIEVSSLSDTESARRFSEMGVRHFIFTDITRDGTLTGINLPTIERFIAKSGVAIIVAGGISSLENIRALKNLPYGIEGIILGKALYTGNLSLPAALALLKE
ncbi:MAG TPA: 1-(5-phosphoribosyl)-5-[(5-phosphoribosylamino)methylideneamino]imidazole-4-carboxamide isomerase [Atribacteraceae bacterium]|nr:1-(5-phosphoribosyl)-5-[(5-phosphoribosylamino)methylideneamino]imidazole-4-carboxamide isomerase [Atribacteraceae bacterium]